MATNFLWGAAGTKYNLLTTELNSLASGSGSAAGPEIDNTTNAWQQGRLKLSIASSSLAFTAASFVEVHFLTSDAGSSYPKYTSGSSYKIARPNYFAGLIYVHPATLSSEAIVEYSDLVLIPLGKFKAVLISSLGVTLPASSNTLDLIPTPSQY